MKPLLIRVNYSFKKWLRSGSFKDFKILLKFENSFNQTL